MEENQRLKVLFLDIDGVINSSRSILSRVGSKFDNAIYNSFCALRESQYPLDLPYIIKDTIDTIDSVAVGLVNRILYTSGAKLVLSSSHRAELTGPEVLFRSKRHMELLNRYLGALGIKHPIFDLTDRLYCSRGVEVATWLEQNPEVEDYVILDDGRDFEPGQHLVWCNPVDGLSTDNYYDACKHLSITESKILS